MMCCQICGDREGPWEYEEDPEDKKYVILVCEDCANMLQRKRKNERRKKFETANIFHKRHVN